MDATPDEAVPDGWGDADMMKTTCTTFAIALAAFASTAATATACTRCVYLGPDRGVIVARSMDWMEDTRTNLYALPRGLKRDGAAGPDSLAWTSKYGSVVAAMYDLATVDGMNEKGLVANVLYLVESDYGKPEGPKPRVSISLWAQYVLDRFETVAEAVAALRDEPFAIVAPVLPNGSPAHGHLAITDATGDTAVFEYVDGKLQVHHGRQYQVMTNSPTFDRQLAINAYWEEIGGDAMLPGTSRASDRFARTSFFIRTIPAIADETLAAATMFSVIRSVSVPLGISTPGKPNIASTTWRTLHDVKNGKVYFDSAASPTVFWARLSDLDLDEGSPVRKLSLTDGETYSGNSSADFREAKPFEFLKAASE